MEEMMHVCAEFVLVSEASLDVFAERLQSSKFWVILV